MVILAEVCYSFDREMRLGRYHSCAYVDGIRNHEYSPRYSGGAAGRPDFLAAIKMAAVIPIL